MYEFPTVQGNHHLSDSSLALCTDKIGGTSGLYCNGGLFCILINETELYPPPPPV